MTLIGLDLDATRARAVCGPAAQPPVPLRLCEPHAELPLAIGLEARQPQLGRAPLTLCRRLPDSVCTDFLPHLGSQRIWKGGRHRLDAARATGIIFEQLARSLGKSQGITVAVPAYLAEEQVALLFHLAEKARWRLLGAVAAPLAAALAARDYLPWSGVALVLDVDGHALTWSAVSVAGDHARVLLSRPLPNLGRHAWMTRLLDGVAHRCVRLSRRDPRESAEAEQYLHDQLRDVLTAPGPADHATELVLQTAQWYQRLTFSAMDFAGFTAPLCRQVIAAMEALRSETAGQGPVGAVVLTAAAARLPGLLAAVDAVLEEPAASATPTAAVKDEEDFGEGLLDDDGVSAGRARALDPDAVARAAHELALRALHGEVSPGLLDAVPLPPRGLPPRIHLDEPDEAPQAVRIPFPTADGPRAPNRRRSPHDKD